MKINTVTVSGQFDYAISDVEELFQRRLVSDVLHSTFRNVLELHIEVNMHPVSNLWFIDFLIQPESANLCSCLMKLFLTPVTNSKGRG